MHGLIAQSSDTSAWSFGGSILTFAFPMLLFIVVALGLYVLYTKPEFVPGHRLPFTERPVSYTAIPGKPTEAPGSPPPVRGNPAAAGGMTTDESESATPEAGE